MIDGRKSIHRLQYKQRILHPSLKANEIFGFGLLVQLFRQYPGWEKLPKEHTGLGSPVSAANHPPLTRKEMSWFHLKHPAMPDPLVMDKYGCKVSNHELVDHQYSNLVLEETLQNSQLFRVPLPTVCSNRHLQNSRGKAGIPELLGDEPNRLQRTWEFA